MEPALTSDPQVTAHIMASTLKDALPVISDGLSTDEWEGCPLDNHHSPGMWAVF